MAGNTNSKGVIAALIAGVLIYGLAMGTIYPLLGIVLSADQPGTWNGANAAATGIGLLIGVFVMPGFARRFGAGFTALFGVVLMVISLAALAYSSNYWVLFAFRLLLGCGANMLFVVTETGLNVFAASGQRGRVMGVYSAAVAIGFVVGPAIVAYTPETPGPLLIGCAAVTAFALLPLLTVRAPVDRSVQPTSSNRVLTAVLTFPFAFGFLFVASAIDAVVISLLPVIALDQGYAIGSGALFVTVFHVGLLVGQPVVGTALDVFGRRRTVLACCFLSLFCTAALVFGGGFGFWPVAWLMFVWGAVNYGLYTAGLALIGDRFAGQALTAATAAFAAVYAIASVISPIAAGQAIDSVGAVGFYLVVAGIYFVTFLFGAAYFRPMEPLPSTP